MLYEEVWVNCLVVECVKPRPEVEAMFQARDGAAQPTTDPGRETASQGEGLSHSMLAGATLMGEHSSMIQQWDFPVDEPVPLAKWRQRRVDADLPTVTRRLEAGETLRVIATDYGVSHETLRRALNRAGT